MNNYFFLADDYRCFVRRLDEIEKMIREISEKDGDPSRPMNDPYYDNFIYSERSRNQFKWCRRLIELIHIRDNARIVSPADRNNVILPGKKVTYRMEGTKAARSLLVGSYFNFCLETAVPCSHPIIGEFVGKNKGETFTAAIHDERLHLSIVDVETPYPMN